MQTEDKLNEIYSNMLNNTELDEAKDKLGIIDKGIITAIAKGMALVANKINKDNVLDKDEMISHMMKEMDTTKIKNPNKKKEALEIIKRVFNKSLK